MKLDHNCVKDVLLYLESVPYDAVDKTRLRVTFHTSICRDSPATIHEMEQLRELIAFSGGKVFSTVAKGTQAIVEFDCIDYDKFIEYKSMGLLVYHAFDVMQCLKEYS